MMFDMTLDKIRSQIRNQRKTQPVVIRDQLSKEISKKAISSLSWQKTWKIAFYMPHDGEVCCLRLLEHAWQFGCDCYLPSLDREKANHLVFIRHTKEAPLITNQYGIKEPVYQASESCSPMELDLVFMPLVAFDHYGHRLGMGGGYYDRTFYFKQALANKKPLLFGLAYDFQRVDCIQPQPWDVHLDTIMTEKKLYEISSLSK